LDIEKIYLLKNNVSGTLERFYWKIGKKLERNLIT